MIVAVCKICLALFIMKKNIKIGLIQTAPLTADFSANLRSIVQAYRDCIDRGAKLVIAPAYALTGPEVLDLSERGSFLQQNQLALETLAKEIAHAPLIIASYSTAITCIDDDIFGILDSDDCEIESRRILCPFLLEDGSVTQLNEGEEIDILGLNVYVEVGNEESVTDIENLDLFVRLSTDSWHAGSSQSNEDSRRWEAQINRCPLIDIHSIGYAEGKVYAGGSCFYSAAGAAVQRMPFFEASQMIITLDSSATARALPQEEELLQQALVCSLRDYAKNMGYVGICLNLDLPNSSLLVLLCTEAVGAQKVYGFSFEHDNFEAEKALGINFKKLSSPVDAESMAQLELLDSDSLQNYKARVNAAILNSFADQKGLVLYSSLNRHQLLLGEFTLYGESCGKLLPFGCLYEMDLYLLCKYINEQRPNYFGALAEPASPQIDHILHRTLDNNCSSNYLIQESDGALVENDVRYVQRRVLTSAEKRAQLPPTLKLEAKEERLSIPICHRLND